MLAAALSGPSSRSEPTPRAPYVLERVIGALVAAIPSAAVVIPLLLDAQDEGALGTLVTPVLVAIPVLVGALIAGGPRGRARLAAAIFGSDRQYVGSRRYILTTKNTERLERLGRALGMVLIFLAGALVCFAKPIVTPHVERRYADAPPDAGAFGALPARLRTELETAAAAGDAEAIAVLQSLAPVRSDIAGEHFTMDGYTAERNVAWPVTGAALLFLALSLVLTRGGLSPAQAARGARS
jgi:hypothetical protein